MPNQYRMRVQYLRHALPIGRMREIAAVVRRATGPRCDCTVPIEILITGFWRRCWIRARVRCAIRKLQRVLPAPLSLDVAVIVQQIIATEHQLPGCYQITQRSDDSHFALIRLALEVDGRCMTTNELLAVLAEQYIALAMQQNGPSLLVPVDLTSSRAGDTRRPAALRPDPLGPCRDLDERRA